MARRSLLALATLALPAARATGLTPIGKVLDLITGLQAKVVAEGEAAHKVYADFAEWCDDRSKQLHFEIDTGKSQVAELEATIAASSASVSSLTEKVASLAGSLSKDEADLKAATGIRAQEEDDFAKEKAELLETIDTLERAIGILQRQKGKASMAQLSNAQNLAEAFDAMVEASVFSSKDARKLTALVQGTDADTGAPAASVYDSQSGGIIETLEGLLDKAQEQLSAAQKKETASMHSFEMVKQSLEDSMQFTSESMTKSKSASAESATLKATSEGDLGMTSKDLSEDTEALAQLHQDCMTKSEDFEASMKSRGEELKALADAKKVIEEATGAAVEQTYSAASFVQVAQRESPSSAFAALRFVRQLSRERSSPALAQLAVRIDSALQASGRSGEGPFAKVKALISDLIVKLEDSAAADSSHKAYCDKELAKSTEKKGDKTAEVEKLSTKVDQLAARSMQLKEEVAALQAALAKLAASQAEMTKLRGEEHAVYVKFKAEVEEGLAGVKAGLKILREYYAKEDTTHGSAVGTGSSIIGLLEVVESDFLKGLAESTATENMAAATAEREGKDNEIEKTTKEQDVKYKLKEIADLDKSISQTTGDKEGVQAELDAVLEYLEKLTQQCSEKVLPYEARKAAREAEIAGLKEALQVLEGETALLQQRKAKRGLRTYTISADGAL